MQRTIAILMALAMLFALCACGNGTDLEDASSEWILVGNDADGETVREEEDIGGDGLITIEGIFFNTAFSTEYQHLIYVVYDITNDTENDLVLPFLDLENGIGSPATLQIGDGLKYDDLYPMNDWMRDGIEGNAAELKSPSDGSVIEAGSSTVRLISCFQIDTEELSEDTELTLRFRTGDFRVSALASSADIQKVSSADQILEKIASFQ